MQGPAGRRGGRRRRGSGAVARRPSSALSVDPPLARYVPRTKRMRTSFRRDPIRAPSAPQAAFTPPAEPLARRLLGTRLHLHALIRFAAAGLLVVAAVIGREVVGIADLDVRGLASLAAAIVAYALVAWLLIRPHWTPEAAAGNHRLLLNVMHATVVLDFLALTGVLWFTGGIRSPFAAFFLLHVMLTSVLLSGREAVASAALAFGLLAALAWGEIQGVLPPELPTGIAGPGPLDFRLALVILAVYGLLFTVVAYLLIGLATVVRAGDAQLRGAYAALERLSSLRRDFLDIAVHNIKAPLGAVTMFLQNLKAGLAGPLNEMQADWVERGLRRLDGLNGFLGDLRLMATLETGGIEERMEPLDLAQTLFELAEEWGPEAQGRGIRFTYDGPSSVPQVRGNERLLREAVANYLSNALKFTPEGGDVVLRAAALPGSLRISVEDTGPGIPVRDQGDLFREFTRLKSSGTPRGDRRGSGIGLSLVKRIVEAHGGSLGCRSEPGRGSEFFLELETIEE